MNQMFKDAKSFKQTLCGAAWARPIADKVELFSGSHGSISRTVCKTTSTFSPQSRYQIKTAVNECLKLSPEGDCADGSHGSIVKWDTSSVTDISGIFHMETLFNSDISKWDVSRVEIMHAMFFGASSFNIDLSKWDVSRVTNMNYMFQNAASFKQTLCRAAWVNSKASKKRMFRGSRGSISLTACKTDSASPKNEKSKEDLKKAIT